MKVHKLLTGEGAEKYLPFALSKLRFLIASSHTIVVQTYQIDDAVISIEIDVQWSQPAPGTTDRDAADYRRVG